MSISLLLLPRLACPSSRVLFWSTTCKFFPTTPFASLFDHHVPRCSFASAANLNTKNVNPDVSQAYAEVSMQPVLSPATAKEFLLQSPRGAYTSMRTLDKVRVVGWPMHVTRLAESYDSIVKRINAEANAAAPISAPVVLLHPSTPLDPVLKDHISHAVKHWASLLLRGRQDCGGQLQHWRNEEEDDNDGLEKVLSAAFGEQELRITVLISAEPQAAPAVTSTAQAPTATAVAYGTSVCDAWPPISIYLTLLPPVPKGPVAVKLAVGGRVSATAKDSQWQRTSPVVTADTNETLLVEPGTGRILEGTSSNFFAVDAHGVVHTAQEGVLEGTIRGLVLEACQFLDIPVVLQAASVAQLRTGTWRAAFITSTSRLVLPIKTIFLDNMDATSSTFSSTTTSSSSTSAAAANCVQFVKDDPLVQVLREKVLVLMREEATRVVT